MDWLFYIAKVHLNYSQQEFLNATFREVVTLWKTHVDFNGWKVKETDEQNNENDKSIVYKKTNIEDIPFL